MSSTIDTIDISGYPLFLECFMHFTAPHPIFAALSPEDQAGAVLLAYERLTEDVRLFWCAEARRRRDGEVLGEDWEENVDAESVDEDGGLGDLACGRDDEGRTMGTASADDQIKSYGADEPEKGVGSGEA